MPLLTTSKLIAVFPQFCSDIASRKLIGLIDAVDANTTANAKLEASLDSKPYSAVRQEMQTQLEVPGNLNKRTGGHSAEVDTLIVGKLELQQNTQYYLIKGFTTSISASQMHIRFENPGQAEIVDFHLTTEEGWTQQKGAKGLRAKGRFFFKIADGGIDPQTVNRILGQGDDQASDMRLAPLVYDAMIIVYYLMYCLRSS
jgi:hypothetical protein